MAYLICTASGTGVSGTTIPKTGTVRFTFNSTGWTDGIRAGLYLYGLDSNGNEITSAGSQPQNAGGSWSNRDNYPLEIGDFVPGSDSNVFTINTSTFLSFYSGYSSNTSGLRLIASIETLEDGWVGDEYFDFYFPQTSACTWDSNSSFYYSPTLTDSTTTLSWSGAKAGTNNSIASYEIQYCKSSDSSSWGTWTALTTVTSTATSGTYTVTVSSYAGYGEYLKFRIRIRGSAGSSYYSSWKESSNTVRRKWAPFGSYTDATLTAKSANIRAVHFTELQERVNVIRPYYGLSAYSFTTITAGVTKISKWATLVQEIRTAIDGITTNHESWNTLEAGKPRIAHITQLRNIIDKL